MTKWIYDYVLTENNADSEKELLNELGEGGWEVCGINNGRYILKKIAPKQKKQAAIRIEDETDIAVIIAHLNKLTNSEYTTQAQATKKCILARLNEGKTVDDFMEVINSRVLLWLTDEKMKQYLRPETLFGNKFESYLNYAKLNKPVKPANSNMEGMVM